MKNVIRLGDPTDHGGKGRNHGAQNEECRHIFIIANGPGVAAKKIMTFTPQAAVAPICIHAMPAITTLVTRQRDDE